MDNALFATALQLVAHSSIALLLAIALGGFLTGILRVATQIDDTAIGFIGRFAGLSLFLLWMSSTTFQQIFQFTLRVWSGSDFYR